ncbi:hypothetical protein EDD86DRAFT_243710 [Gorgonomyces haynaldii]|nr:hypothetical protein EDD86DRAFT_243710 [Gorgonomyces haynaldii]
MSVTPYLLGNFMKSDLIFMTGQDKMVAMIASFLCSIGLVVSPFVIYAIIRLPNKESGQFMILSVTMSNTLYLTTVLAYSIVNLSNGYIAVGRLGCILTDVLIVFSCYFAISSLTGVAGVRYCRIVCDMQVERQAEYWSSFGFFVLSLGMSLLPVYSGREDDLLRLSPSKVICIFRITEGGETIPKIMVIPSMILLGTCMFITVFCYVRIYQRVTKINRAAQELDQMRPEGTDPNLDHSTMMSQERKLFRRSATLTGTFLVFWIPYYALFFYELISDTIVSGAFDAIACFSIMCFASLEPYLTMYFSKPVRRRVMGYLRLKSEGSKPGSNGPSIMSTRSQKSLNVL